MGHYRRDKGFPDWFQLEKYSNTQQFKASDWLAALRIRKSILDALTGLEKAGLEPCYAYQIMPETYAELTALRKAPLDNTGCGSWAVIAGEFSDTSLSLPVREMKFVDIARLKQEAALNAENGECPFDPWKELEKWPNLPDEVMRVPLRGKEQSFEPLLVDMRATNAVLIKSFEAWLKKARSEQRGRSKQKRPNYTSWSGYGLLPYLDLLIWRKEERVRRSSEEMAQAVGYDQTDENFQATVMALARRLMSDLGELEALAAEEECRL